jgi:methionine biosynthesis protein MetW
MVQRDGDKPLPPITPSRALALRELLRAAFPTENELFPDLYTGYEEYHEHVETGHLARARLIAPWIDAGARVLDAGCGDGLTAAVIRDAKHAVVEGIDVAQAAVMKTLGRGIPAHVHDLDRDPTLPEGFDFILFVEVLEHLRAPHLVLSDALRKARRAVIVTIPNSAWMGYRFQLAFGHTPVQSFTHLHMWSHLDFVAFCRRLGAPPPELKYLSSGRGARAWLTSRWPNLFVHQLAYRIPIRDAR